MSKFKWTDKNSTKWFILLPSGHVGPYSLNQVLQLKERNKIGLDVKLWAEGLGEPVSLLDILTEVDRPKKKEVIKSEEITPPPIPIEKKIKPRKNYFKIFCDKLMPLVGYCRRIVLTLLICFVVFLGFKQLMNSGQEFHINRLSKMSPELHQRILGENNFSGRTKEIFFKEYISEDYSHIWLITNSDHRCEVEVSFNSINGNLLSLEDSKIVFHSKGKLANHVVGLSTFQFLKGSRILPGIYEMDIRANDCEWDGFIPLARNAFTPPEAEYLARTRVILHPKGPLEFQAAFDQHLKKRQLKEKEKLVAETKKRVVAHEDLIQKFNTLEAVSNQIEQHFLKYLANNPKELRKKMDMMVNSYSKNFGYFLTSFVIDNENAFKKQTKNDPSARQDEEDIRLTSKKIGLESMKFIEEIQKIKKTPSQKEIKKLIEKVQRTFSSIRKEISQKLSRLPQN